jgi:hypothetical protein
VANLSWLKDGTEEEEGADLFKKDSLAICAKPLLLRSDF